MHPNLLGGALNNSSNEMSHQRSCFLNIINFLVIYCIQCIEIFIRGKIESGKFSVHIIT